MHVDQTYTKWVFFSQRLRNRLLNRIRQIKILWHRHQEKKSSFLACQSTTCDLSWFPFKSWGFDFYRHNCHSEPLLSLSQHPAKMFYYIFSEFALSSQGQTKILEATLPIFSISINWLLLLFSNDTAQLLCESKNVFDIVFGSYFDVAADDCLRTTSTRLAIKKKKTKKNTWTANSLFVAQFLALIIIIATTCHFFHYNTVRAVPVTVWEDGWEEMCLYCNLAQRVCSLTQTRNFLWNAVKNQTLPPPPLEPSPLPPSPFFFLWAISFSFRPPLTHLSFRRRPSSCDMPPSPVTEEAGRIATVTTWLVVTLC